MKEQLRKKFLKTRKDRYFILDKKKRNFISNKLKQICRSNKIKKLGFYYPTNYEIDILSVLFKIKNIDLYLPVIKKKNDMSFKLHKVQEPLFVNRFGILEPNKENKTEKPQIILVPVVAFDKNKNRLGYGKGFYDRFLNKSNYKKNILSIGIAFSFQQIKNIPLEKHDKRLDYILTEKSIIN